MVPGAKGAKMRFSIRDLLWATVVVALGLVVWRAWYGIGAGIDWEPFSQAALRDKVDRGIPVLVFADANWTISTAMMEPLVVNSTPVRRVLAKHKIATLRINVEDRTSDGSRFLEMHGFKSVPAALLFRGGSYPSCSKLPGTISETEFAESIEQALSEP
jgi:thiol:disulfide interchange protein